ncbi:MAG TPA: hypothetical protein PLS00_07570, partial [Niabella sp.]|jgi:hypothetical protein|nr:hypothetical protein [Chitinophagaceae bacterium]HRN49053.1 hypothetical protein [Niabella sp.]HUN02699.1 hypothetical protein [Niabella sp.]
MLITNVLQAFVFWGCAVGNLFLFFKNDEIFIEVVSGFVKSAIPTTFAVGPKSEEGKKSGKKASLLAPLLVESGKDILEEM